MTLLAPLLALAVLAPNAAAGPPARVSTLVVYGADPCPRSSDPNEITVCARQPESERYRIPRKLRKGRAPLANQESWATTARDLEWVSRDGRPNSCSVVGSGGFTGCYSQFLQRARDERALLRRDAGEIP